MDVNTLINHYSVQLDVLMNALIALLLGGLVGFERELKGRPAGMRTHMLVTVAAALFVNLSQLMAETGLTGSGSNGITFDPSRALVAVVTGVSFLGAGTIFRSEDGVKGLTTAATLLFASALGITVAIGEYLLALTLTVFVLTALRTLAVIEKRVSKGRS